MRLPVKPMLAKSAPAPDGTFPAPFGKDGWIWQTKYDGHRVLADLRPGEKPRLWARSGRLVTDEYPQLLEHLQVNRPVILDGEIVFIDATGKTDFQKLIARGLIPREQAAAGIAFIAFDMLADGPEDIFKQSLVDRLHKLNAVMEQNGNPHFLEATSVDNGIGLWLEVQARGHEGVIAKPVHSPYRFGERGTWLKYKVTSTDTFRIVGYVPGVGSRVGGIGSVILGQQTPAGWRYAGVAGTGFNAPITAQLLAAFRPIRQGQSVLTGPDLQLALKDLSKLKTHADGSQTRPIDTVEWLTPSLDALIEYGEIMDGGALRFPVFKELVT